MEQILEMLGSILQAVIIAVIPIITTYIINFVKAKATKIKLDTEDQFLFSTIDMIEDIVERVVTYVSQTYVDGLKKDGQFNVEEQKIAFNMAYDRIVQFIDDEHKAFLESIFGNFRDWISVLIESAVNKQKI